MDILAENLNLPIEKINYIIIILWIYVFWQEKSIKVYRFTKKNCQFFELWKTQGDHALFRPFEFLRKITENSYNGNWGIIIL